MRTVTRISVAVVSAVLAGCGACGGTGIDELRVPGDHAFVRCLDAEPPEAREWDLAEARLALTGRTLTVDGLGASMDLAVFSGPAPSSASIAPALEPLRADPPDAVLVLGDLGDDPASLRATLAALATLDVLVLLVPGGRDEAPAYRDALAALEPPVRDRVLDAAPLDVVRLGDAIEVLPVAGAPGGRYARTDDACGFRAEDLERRAERIGSAGAMKRVLFSWAAPVGALSSGLEGADAGDRALGRFARSTGASSGLHAFPREAAGRTSDREGGYRAIVGSIAGRVGERTDGARALPSIVRLSANTNGLSPVSGNPR